MVETQNSQPVEDVYSSPPNGLYLCDTWFSWSRLPVGKLCRFEQYIRALVAQPAKLEPIRQELESDKAKCEICNAESHGFYYGAHVCQACKKFFERHRINTATLKPCTCKNGGSLKRVRKCASCRFKKCLQLGMKLSSDMPSYSKEASRRGFKRTSDQLLTFQLVCLVCGRDGTGIHYGVATCEGCKVFFHRASRTPSFIRSSCHNEANCLSLGGLNALKKCNHCRYQRCIAIGMNTTQHKNGRMSNADKLRIKRYQERMLTEVKMLLNNFKPERISSVDDTSLPEVSWLPADAYNSITILIQQQAEFAQRLINNSDYNKQPVFAHSHDYADFNVRIRSLAQFAVCFLKSASTVLGLDEKVCLPCRVATTKSSLMPLAGLVFSITYSPDQNTVEYLGYNPDDVRELLKITPAICIPHQIGYTNSRQLGRRLKAEAIGMFELILIANLSMYSFYCGPKLSAKPVKHGGSHEECLEAVTRARRTMLRYLLQYEAATHPDVETRAAQLINTLLLVTKWKRWVQQSARLLAKHDSAFLSSDPIYHEILDQ